jgi:hypothetical protein
MTTPAPPIPDKDAAAILQYFLDWSVNLPAGVTIMGTPTVTADAGLDVNPAGKQTTIVGGKVFFWLGGGKPQTWYSVYVTITTSDGGTDRRIFDLHVVDRVIG